MGEMITSFDGMKLYLNKEIPEKKQRLWQLLSMVCASIRGDTTTWPGCFMRLRLGLTGLITGAWQI